MLGKKQISQDMDRPASDAALREYYDKNYQQVLPIIAKKVHQEKVQQEKLKAAKSHLNFEEVSKHSESGTPSTRRNLWKRLGSRRVRNVFESPEPRRGWPESLRKKDLERKTLFKRLEKGVFHRLGDKGKSMSTYSNDSRCQSYHNSRKDTKGYYQSSRSRGTEPALEKYHNKRASSHRTKALSKKEGSAGGHWKLRLKSKGQALRMTIYPSHGYARKLTHSLLAFVILISQKGPECQVMSKHMTKARIQKTTSRSFRQQQKWDVGQCQHGATCSTPHFMDPQRGTRNHENLRIHAWNHKPELIKRLHDKILKSVDEMMRITSSFLRGRWQLATKSGRNHFRCGNNKKPDINRISKKEVLKICKDQNEDRIGSLKKSKKQILEDFNPWEQDTRRTSGNTTRIDPFPPSFILEAQTQTKLNLTEPNWDASDFLFKKDNTIISKPRAVIYRDKNDQKKMIREMEVHKFSDGTLTRILEKLDHMVKDFKLFKYNPGMETRIWSEDDRIRSKEFMEVIKERFKTRRIFRSLESFVSGRLRDVDYRLIQRTE
nr:hypothetical protein [Tanacetum cinerariifolium]